MRHIFRNLISSALMLIAGVAAAQNTPVNSPADWANPLMGTNSSYELSNGNTYPAVAVPWGMNFWTAQTGKMRVVPVTFLRKFEAIKVHGGGGSTWKQRTEIII